MPHIFVSHATKDDATVDRIIDALSAANPVVTATPPPTLTIFVIFNR